MCVCVIFHVVPPSPMIWVCYAVMLILNAGVPAALRESYDQEKVNVRGLIKEQQTLARTASLKVWRCFACEIVLFCCKLLLVTRP